MKKRILIVDDEPSIRKVLHAHLTRQGYEVQATPSAADAVSILQQSPFDLVVSDLRMPGMDGMELLAWCRTNHPGLPLILITAHGTVDSAVEAIKLGAFDYVTKPFDQDELSAVIGKAVRTGEAGRRKLVDQDVAPVAILGQTAVMRELRELVARVADTPSTVLIEGEAGTGKELVARVLHDRSNRVHGPFIQVDCGAVQAHQLEAELFGSEPGPAGRGAGPRAGRLELAHQGTLFLDETNALPLDVQARLFGFSSGRGFRRVGGLSDLDADLRLVAGTTEPLEDAVRRGAFRQDLYYRLNVVPLRLPPLRERAPDIPLLVQYFLDRFNKRLARRVEGVTPEGMAALVAHPWPGNIRELENRMERAVLLAETPLLGARDLGLEPRERPAPSAPDEEPALGLKEYLRVYTIRLERARIQQVLEDSSGNVTHASRRLGISRKSLQTKMKEYGLRPAPGRGDGEERS